MHSESLAAEATAASIQIGDDQTRDRRVQMAFWCVTVLFGFLQAWNNRHVMNSDGISYLDMSDAYLQHGWKMLINGHWSPMYPWLIAVARSILKPSGYWEFTVVHLVNFLAFLGAAAAFNYLVGEILKTEFFSSSDGLHNHPLPSWALRAIAYLAFLWASLTLITLERKSPDMLMSIFVYLAFALVLGIRRSPRSWMRFALLGAVLGLGYLAKAPMFPLAFLLVGTAIYCVGSLRTALPRALLALTIFVAISAPLVIGLSRMKGRLTFGDSGRWNYIAEIDGAGPIWYMQDVGSAGGKFIHPPQKIFDVPPTYAFQGPIGGTLPVWYDPSYWIDGAKPRLNIRRQAIRLLKNAGIYFDLLFSHDLAFLAAFVVLCAVGAKGWFRRVVSHWPLWLTTIAALVMYAIVLVDPRYVAVFLIVLWLTLYRSVRLPREMSPRMVTGIVLALLIAVGTPLSLSAIEDFNNGIVHRQRHVQWQVAQQLRHMGLQPGDMVGRVGGLHRVEWARVLHVRVIAEIPREHAGNFWSSKPEVQAQVIASMKNVGATAIIAEEMPPDASFLPGPGWQQIGKSNLYAYFIGKDVANP